MSSPDPHPISAEAKEAAAKVLRPLVIAEHAHCCSEPGCAWDGFLCQCRDEALDLAESVLTAARAVDPVHGERDALKARVAQLEEGMSWVSGHDRQGLDHLDEAMKACEERDKAEAERDALREEVDRLRGHVMHALALLVDTAMLLGSGERLAADIDTLRGELNHLLPTVDDVRGILAPQEGS